MAKRKEAPPRNKKNEEKGKTKGEISSFPSETKSEKEKETYILDTNVVLNDPYCLKHFGKHNICIPIMVLEELDKFKKGNEPNNVNTRIFHRIFNGFGDGLFNGGISLGENRGKLTVALGVDLSSRDGKIILQRYSRPSDTGNCTGQKKERRKRSFGNKRHQSPDQSTSIRSEI